MRSSNCLRKLYFFLLTFLIFILQTPVYAQSKNNEVDVLIKREMQERRIPGLQVAVVKNGKIVLFKSYGMAHLQYSIPVNNKSLFSINSCTKAFTGVAIMQLVEEGKVDLSAPVASYLEGLPADWQTVKISQMLTHVSGLPDINRVLYPINDTTLGIKSEAAAWNKVQTTPMDFATGERFSYNQTNYVLLGKIIEKFHGKAATEVFREKEFQPAGMSATIFGDSRDIIPNKTQPYRYIRNLDGNPLSEEKLVNAYEEMPKTKMTSSGINSTAKDVALWTIALQQGKLLKTKEALNTLWTAGKYNNGSPTQWAMGWVTKPRPKHRAIISTGGSRSAFFVYPEDDLTVVVLTNLVGGYAEDFIDELAGIYQPEIAAADPVTALRIELRKRGYENSIEIYDELKKKDSNFQPLENDLNDWGYRLMNGLGKKKEALGVLKLNAVLYPKSANAYDSVAEAYAANNEKALAIENYKRSLELDPKNTNAVQWLKKLDPNYK
jgi:CubicO group peptidase (beta-lactamase class C family)